MHPAFAVAHRIGHYSSQPKTTTTTTTTTTSPTAATTTIAASLSDLNTISSIPTAISPAHNGHGGGTTVSVSTTNSAPAIDTNTPATTNNGAAAPPLQFALVTPVAVTTTPPPTALPAQPPVLKLGEDMMILARAMRLSTATQQTLATYDASTLEDFCCMTDADFSSMVVTDTRLGKPIPPLQQRKIRILHYWCLDIVREYTQEQADAKEAQRQAEVKARQLAQAEAEQPDHYGVEVAGPRPSLHRQDSNRPLPQQQQQQQQQQQLQMKNQVTPERFGKLPHVDNDGDDTGNLTMPSFWDRVLDPMGTLKEATRMRYRIDRRRQQQFLYQMPSWQPWAQSHSPPSDSPTATSPAMSIGIPKHSNKDEKEEYDDKNTGGRDGLNKIEEDPLFLSQHVLIPPDWEERLYRDLPGLKRQLLEEGERNKTFSWSNASDSFMTLRWVFCGYGS